jgi:antitoxin (DNA-binding transcriptional repressor) of toxin-antitoxin stability system
MRTVNIAVLKNQLSKYITYAKAGETITIRDRNTAVAQIIPFPHTDNLTDEERELVAAGLMRLPEKPWNPAAFLALPRPKVKGNAGIQAIIDDRNEGL